MGFANRSLHQAIIFRSGMARERLNANIVACQLPPCHMALLKKVCAVCYSGDSHKGIHTTETRDLLYMADVARGRNARNAF